MYYIISGIYYILAVIYYIIVNKRCSKASKCYLYSKSLCDIVVECCDIVYERCNIINERNIIVESPVL